MKVATVKFAAGAPAVAVTGVPEPGVSAASATVAVPYGKILAILGRTGL